MKKSAVILSCIYFHLITAANIQAQQLYDQPGRNAFGCRVLKNLNGARGQGGRTNNGSKEMRLNYKKGETRSLFR
jgi:hypothetical protein